MSPQPSRAALVAALMTAIKLTGAWDIPLPPCTDPFKPFVYSGCYSDPSDKEALTFRSSLSSSDMTVEKCVAECKGNGYRYAGLEYYGECFCGQTVNAPRLDEGECTFPCSGNQTETCGGDSKVSVWADPTFESFDDVTIADYKSIGCYTDDSSIGRALPEQYLEDDSASLTTENCLHACKDQGFPIAGTEYGGECWCGVVIGNYSTSVSDSQCNTPCNGDSDETCGGPSRLSMYVAKELESLEPCGYDGSTTSSSSVGVSTNTQTVHTSTSMTSEVMTTTTTKTQATTETTSSMETTSSEKPSSSSATSTTMSSSSKSLTTDSSSASSTMMTKTSKSGHTTTTSSSALCTTTVVTPPSCEYECGSWCCDPIPDWSDGKGCKAAHSSCKLQIASCFKHAGWPGSMKCFEFAGWCALIDKYCGAHQGGGDKGGCFGQYPPHWGGGGKGKSTTSTSVYPCSATSTPYPTSTKGVSTKAHSTTASATTSCPIETPTSLCKQPSSNKYGYGPGKPVGGIELPVVTCNDLEGEFGQGKCWRLYSEKNSRDCGSWTRPHLPNACEEACKVQYEQCKDTYAKGCDENDKGGDWGHGGGSWDGDHHDDDDEDSSSGGRWSGHSGSSGYGFGNGGHWGSWKQRRTFGWGSWGNGGGKWGDSGSDASSKCYHQYKDCLGENEHIDGKGKCEVFGRY